MRKTKLALLQSVLALLLCCAMLIGTTFAWFTDSVTSGVNRISAGNLDVELEYLDKNGAWKKVTEQTNVFAEDTLWEPGHTEVVYLRISNQGTLALKYQLGVNIVSETPSVNVDGDPLILSEYIRFGLENNRDGKTAPWADRAAAIAAVSGGAKKLSAGLFGSGKLYPTTNCPTGGKTEQYVAMVVYMPESVGNEANYMTGKNAPEIMLGLSLVATQQTHESDSFDETYDAQSKFPPIKPGAVSEQFAVVGGKTAEAKHMQGEGFSADVPVGVKVDKELLTLSISEMAGSNSNISLASNELRRSLDVHMDGVAADNTVPMKITVEQAMMVGLNSGNFTLYHVENNVPVAMTAVSDIAELDAHNEFYYDPATGDVTLCMATFSEVALVADIKNAWNGELADSFAGGDGTEADPYLIANADQLAYLSAVVGGMNGLTQDSFTGKYIKLLVNINLGDAEEDNNPDLVFYPIGYYNSEGTYEKTGTAITSGFKPFEGIFDGNGHKISNIYQNTWEMKGDHNWYDPEDQHYRDGMGIFGKVYGGTVKNLTVDNFKSDGEIATTGVIAAYAEGATFENIAITKCNPRVYNIGNGGIVGCVGWYAVDAGLKTTFKNITVDNTNKISALWGSWDVACGGIVGQYYPTSGQSSADYPANGGMSFENCHISAQIDVYNDVCANYQYYAYRYAGMLIGSVRENVTVDGRVYPDMTGISAENCTVHFGDWNDYYYCELVANSLASYTHDHQFSRLTQVAAVNGKTVTSLTGEEFTVPAEGRYNYVVVNGAHATENATCYHFVNGEVWNHKTAGEETVDGKTVLKEDKQHIYLEFNNLFTGYGWGVTSKGLTDFEGVENMDITAGDHENSVQKFYGNSLTELAENSAIKVGTIFSAHENTGVAIIPGALTVTVTNMDDSNPVSAVFTRDANNWADSTITFSGTGRVQITIQDYYFCNPTTIELDITANCIKNYNFDNDLSDWNGTFSSTNASVEVIDGAAEFTANSSESAAGALVITQQFTYDDDVYYDEFTLKLDFEKLSGTSKAYVMLKFRDGVNTTSLSYQNLDLSETGHYEIVAVAPAGTVQVRVEIGNHSSGTINYRVDNVTLSREEILLYDFIDGSSIPSAEQETWFESTAGAETVLENESSSNYIIGRGNNNKLVFQSAATKVQYFAKSPEFAVTGGKTYAVAYQAAHYYSTDVLTYAQISFVDADSNLLHTESIIAFDPAAEDGAWTDMLLTATAPEGAVRAFLKFTYLSYATSGSLCSYWVRNLSVKESETPTASADTNLLLNGDFSNECQHWDVYVGAEAGTVTGGQLHIDATSTGFRLRQKAYAEPGKKYYLYVDYTPIDVTSAPFVIIKFYKSDGSTNTDKTVYLDTSLDSNVQHSLSYSAVAPADTIAVEAMLGTNGENEYYIDNVILTECIFEEAFESKASDWTISGSGTGFYNNKNGNETYALFLQIAGNSAECPSFSVTAYEKYAVSFISSKRDENYASAAGSMEVIFYSGETVLSSHSVDIAPGEAMTWLPETHVITAPAGATNAKLIFTRPGCSYAIDDLSVTRIAN